MRTVHRIRQRVQPHEMLLHAHERDPLILGTCDMCSERVFHGRVGLEDVETQATLRGTHGTKHIQTCRGAWGVWGMCHAGCRAVRARLEPWLLLLLLPLLPLELLRTFAPAEAVGPCVRELGSVKHLAC